MAEITSDTFNTSSYGFEFAGDGDTLTIAQSILVGSSQSFAIYSTQSNNTLFNNGQILSGEADGVYSGGDHFSLTNDAEGAIFGKQYGVNLDCDGSFVNNHGYIYSFTQTGIYTTSTSNHAVISNDGNIYGRYEGVRFFSNGDGGSLKNYGSGTIRADGDGVYIYTAAGLATTITNAARATISGGEYAIHTEFVGEVALINNGKLIGGIFCEAAGGIDSIANRGSIKGTVDLGSGNDIFKDLGNGSVTGPVHGGDGHDTLTAGRARETFFGDGDNDSFVYNNIAFSRPGAKRDSIRDFSHAEHDKIDLHVIDAQTGPGNQAFRFSGTQAFHHHKGELHYRVAGGNAIVEADLNGDGKADFALLLNTVAHLAAGDFVL